MTCEQFRSLNVDGRGVFRMTRAERAAAAKHYAHCLQCREYLHDIGNSESPETVDDMIRRKALLAADKTDPEFLETLLS